MKRTTLIGCGVALALFVVVIGFFVAAIPKMWRRGASWVSAQMAEVERTTAIEQAWRAPSETVNASWFPGELGDWLLQSAEPATRTDLSLDRPGMRGFYRSKDGRREVNVTILAANDLEKEAMFTRVTKAITTNAGSHRMTHLGNRAHVTVRGTQHTRLWWMKNWLFIFESSAAGDPKGFADAFVESMAASAPVVLEAPEPK